MWKTDKAYYADTTHISSSMIRAYLRSPAYYKALYIDKSVKGPDSPSIDFGQALDTLLTQGKRKFNQRFTKRVLKGDAPKAFEKLKTTKKTILSADAYDMVFIAQATIRATAAFQWLESHDTSSQLTLTGKLAGSPIKGRLDWLTIEGPVAYITDLKTTTNLHPTKYYYHCLDLSYALQMALYRELVFQNYPQVEGVACQHLVVSKDSWPQVATFTFHKDLLKKELFNIIGAIEGITAGKFEEKDVTWDNTNMLEDKYAVSTSESDTGEES